MPRLGPPQPGHFYPKLVYNSITLLFDDPPTIVRTPQKPIGNGNIAHDGTEEFVGDRLENTVLLAWKYMEPALLEDVEDYWETWGWLKKPAVLTLDVYGTAAGQREYRFNTFFTKAICQTNPFDPQRTTLGAPVFHVVELLFRQGGPGN